MGFFHLWVVWRFCFLEKECNIESAEVHSSNVASNYQWKKKSRPSPKPWELKLMQIEILWANYLSWTFGGQKKTLQHLQHLWVDVCTIQHGRGQLFCAFSLSLLNLILLFAIDPCYQLGKQHFLFVTQLLTCDAKLHPRILCRVGFVFKKVPERNARTFRQMNYRVQ